MNLRALGVVLLALAAGLAGGCTGSKDKGKNQDYDRPRQGTPK
jgi:hypothetical protein